MVAGEACPVLVCPSAVSTVWGGGDAPGGQFPKDFGLGEEEEKEEEAAVGNCGGGKKKDYNHL